MNPIHIGISVGLHCSVLAILEETEGGKLTLSHIKSHIISRSFKAFCRQYNIDLESTNTYKEQMERAKKMKRKLRSFGLVPNEVSYKKMVEHLQQAPFILDNVRSVSFSSAGGLYNGRLIGSIEHTYNKAEVKVLPPKKYNSIPIPDEMKKVIDSNSFTIDQKRKALIATKVGIYGAKHIYEEGHEL